MKKKLVLIISAVVLTAVVVLLMTKPRTGTESGNRTEGKAGQSGDDFGVELGTASENAPQFGEAADKQPDQTAERPIQWPCKSATAKDVMNSYKKVWGTSDDITDWDGDVGKLLADYIECRAAATKDNSECKAMDDYTEVMNYNEQGSASAKICIKKQQLSKYLAYVTGFDTDYLNCSGFVDMEPQIKQQFNKYGVAVSDFCLNSLRGKDRICSQKMYKPLCNEMFPEKDRISSRAYSDRYYMYQAFLKKDRSLCSSVHGLNAECNAMFDKNAYCKSLENKLSDLYCNDKRNASKKLINNGKQPVAAKASSDGSAN